MREQTSYFLIEQYMGSCKIVDRAKKFKTVEKKLNKYCSEWEGKRTFYIVSSTRGKFAKWLINYSKCDGRSSGFYADVEFGIHKLEVLK